MEEAYYKTKESVAEYINLAKDVSGIKLIEKLNPFLEPGASLLELGSGPGTDWKILNQKYQVLGSDNSIEFLKHLKQSNPAGAFIELDAISLQTDKKFDGLFSNKVLHHLKDSELKNSIQRQTEILKPGGIVCHSFWKGDGTEIFKGMFVNYHTKSDLINLFRPFFKIIVTESYAEFEEGDSILLIARKK